MDDKVDPRLSMFLDEWQENVREGKTVGGLHDSLREHRDDDSDRFEDILSQLRDLRESRAHDAGVREAQKSFHEIEASTNGTGRHIIPPAMVAVNVTPELPEHREHRERERGMRHSSLRPIALPSWLSHALRTGSAKALYLVLAALLGAILHHFGVTVISSAGAPSAAPPAHETPVLKP